ncbi:MAG TPA: SDR family oxidoreductase [Ilumatobacteraceae bacterium]|nr:SDR family oxidoreductase [Ilumatobacteraceae bacterium]
MADRPVALVTGGSRGIGAAVCRLAARDGYDVVINHFANPDGAAATADAVRAAGGRALVIQADVADEAAVVAMFAALDTEFGRVDLLVNNAGVAGGYGELATVSGPALDRLWAVNITGAFLCAREAAARMRTDHDGRGGSIVNITSKAAVLGGSFEWVHYAASKGALDTMTTGLAKELAAVGVRVNAVRPGLVESDFHLHAPPGRVERMAPQIPMQRSCTTDEVAEAVVWLASPAASYVTGTFLDVTGGR